MMRSCIQILQSRHFVWSCLFSIVRKRLQHVSDFHEFLICILTQGMLCSKRKEQYSCMKQRGCHVSSHICFSKCSSLSCCITQLCLANLKTQLCIMSTAETIYRLCFQMYWGRSIASYRHMHEAIPECIAVHSVKLSNVHM